ncbi:hypothetical protein TYRP_002865 [Tyrophagus putrescentiae]|nr:hypothetical protein TYRP_002865 [Tyrophagus putrescentiae]
MLVLGLNYGIDYVGVVVERVTNGYDVVLNGTAATVELSTYTSHYPIITSAAHHRQQILQRLVMGIHGDSVPESELSSRPPSPPPGLFTDESEVVVIEEEAKLMSPAEIVFRAALVSNDEEETVFEMDDEEEDEVMRTTFSGCFFRWCCISFALLAYCLWHQLQKCGCVVMLPTVAEKVELTTMPFPFPPPPLPPLPLSSVDIAAAAALFRFEAGSALPEKELGWLGFVATRFVRFAFRRCARAASFAAVANEH